MLRSFRLCQFVVPATLFPLSHYLWLVRYDRNHGLAALSLSIPVVYVHVIREVGAKWFKL